MLTCFSTATLRRLSVFALTAVLAIVGGCAGFGEPGWQLAEVTAENRVFSDPPKCIAIIPTYSAIDPLFVSLVEDALERHLSVRVQTVVSSDESRRMSELEGIDLTSTEGLAAFAKLSACDAQLFWQPRAAGSEYALVWTARRVDLELAVRRPSDDAVLWAARSAVTRHDGGLPFNPIAAAIGAVRAAHLEKSSSVLASMVDDAIRAMFADGPI